MAEDILPNFEHKLLEADIKRLTEEIQKHQEQPETARLTGPELVKKSIQSITAAPPSPQTASQSAASPLPDYTAGAPPETKLEIEHLLDTAFHHGIEKADAEARKSSPFVMDAFHDALVTKLYSELQKRGIVT